MGKAPPSGGRRLDLQTLSLDIPTGDRGGSRVQGDRIRDITVGDFSFFFFFLFNPTKANGVR